MYLLRSGLTHDRRALVVLPSLPNASHVPTTISLTKSCTLLMAGVPPLGTASVFGRHVKQRQRCARGFAWA